MRGFCPQGRLRLAALALPLFASGCLAKTALGVVTLPVKAAGKAIDVATTSQSEADRNFGRKARKAEARDDRARRKADQRCRRNAQACAPDTPYRDGEGDDGRYSPK